MAGSPSWATLKSQLAAGVKIIEANRAFGDSTTLADVEAFIATLEGDFMPSRGANWAKSMRRIVSETASGSRARAFFDSWLLEFGKFADSTGSATNIGRLVEDFYEYMHDNAQTIESRAITFATPAAAVGNTGDGTLERLTVDKNGYTLDSTRVQPAILRCYQDQTTGSRERHTEKFQFFGVNESPDWLDRANTGSGSRSIVGLTSRHSGSGQGGSLLQNSGFDTSSNTTTLDEKFPGWTIGTDATVIDIETTTTYRKSPGSAAAGAISFTGDETISQTFDSRGLKLSTRVPIRASFAYRRVASCDGDLSITVGTTTATIDLSTATNDVWAILSTPATSAAWPTSLYADNAAVTIELQNNTTGTVIVDDVIFSEWDAWNGHWYQLRGGQTPAQVDDEFTWTDTGGAATTAKIYYWWQLAGLGNLPSTTGTPTIAEPV